MTKNAPARTPALKKAQAKYGSTLRQFKIALSRERDMTLIALLENIPNLKNWAINHIRKENRMKIKVIKIDNTRRLVKGKYADVLDLDYTQSLSALRKDIEFALPDLLESLSLIDNLTTSGNIRVYEGSNHLDIIVDGKGSLNWLIVENHPL